MVQNRAILGAVDFQNWKWKPLVSLSSIDSFKKYLNLCLNNSEKIVLSL